MRLGVPAQLLATIRLEGMLDRWTREYKEIQCSDPERARHLAQAIADLTIVIARKRPHAGNDPVSHLWRSI